MPRVSSASTGSWLPICAAIARIWTHSLALVLYEHGYRGAAEPRVQRNRAQWRRDAASARGRPITQDYARHRSE